MLLAGYSLPQYWNYNNFSAQLSVEYYRSRNSFTAICFSVQWSIPGVDSPRLHMPGVTRQLQHVYVNGHPSRRGLTSYSIRSLCQDCTWIIR